MEIPILFEDDYLLVIDKPSGIAVNRSENEKNETVQDWFRLRQGYSGQADEKSDSDFIKRAGIVHRLDKETSGLLLIAKNEETFSKLQEQFKNRTVKKSYFVLVHGRIEAKSFVINKPVGRLPWNRRKFGVLDVGREAQTQIDIINIYQDKNKNLFTLSQASPHTGRTHQIRIHLAHIGHSVVSDRLYAGHNVYKDDLKICPRLFLHARKLQFVNPVNREIMQFESKLPGELAAVIKLFDKI